MSDSPDAPPAPDYAAAAQATAQGNADAARIAAKANRVSQYTPYGNLVYTQGSANPTFNQTAYDSALNQYHDTLSKYNNYAPSTNLGGIFGGRLGLGLNSTNNRGPAPTAPNQADFWQRGDPDIWSSTTTLSPAEQQKLESNNQLSQGFLDTANNALGQVQGAVDKGFDFGALPQQQINAGQTAQDAIMSRLNPQFDRQEERLRQQMANQGIGAGTDAWNNEFRTFNQGKNDAETQAVLQGMGIGQQARQQALQEQEFGRTEPINIINALRTGNQVQMPQFGNTPQQATTAGPDMLGAANAGYQGQLGAYNAQQAGQGNFMGGLFQLGAAAMPYVMAASDRRLKRDITPIEKTPAGHQLYSYKYLWDDIEQIGVMADEVEHIPGAVVTHSSGYKMVDYSRIH